jgi:hypothetical protein
MTRAAEAAMDRERIAREADPVQFLADVMNGKPVVELDWEGDPMGFARPTMDHRMVAADRLLKKLVPDLKAVEATDPGSSQVTFVFNSPIPLPGSQTGNRLPADLDRLQLEASPAVDPAAKIGPPVKD